jgi:hypothetical protein
MATEELGIHASALILNACHERRLSEVEEAQVLRLAAQAPGGRLAPGVGLAGALVAARRHIRRRKLTRFYQNRLKRALPLPMVSLPFLFEEDLGLSSIRLLAARLEAA